MLLFRTFSVMMIIVMIASSLFASSDIESGDSPEYLFYQGNSHYKNGLYDEALAEYSKITEAGLESGNLYFNMGNAYFKKGDLGKAVLYYERASRLIPNDSDLKSNHKYAISKIENIVTDPENSFIHNILSKFDVLTIDGLTFLLSALYICIVMFLITIMYFRNIKRQAVLFITILSFLLVLTTYSLYERASSIDKEAIIISESVDVKFEPIDNATTYFTVPEGMKIYILESKKDWSKAERFDGKAGWIMSLNMERI